MIGLKEILTSLKDEPEASRTLDEHLAVFSGWVRNAEGKWLSPSHEQHDELPFFSSNLDDTLKLAMSVVAEGTTLGCGWEPGRGSGSIGGDTFYQAATPARALCVAIVSAKVARDKN